MYPPNCSCTIQCYYVVRIPLVVNILTGKDFLSYDTVFFGRIEV